MFVNVSASALIIFMDDFETKGKDDTFLVQEIFQLVRPPVLYPQSRYHLFLSPKILCSLIIFTKKSLMTNFFD